MSSGALSAPPRASNVEKKVDDGYIPMNWQEDGGRKTHQMLQYIKQDHILRKSLYPAKGEVTTSLTGTRCHQQIAEELLKDDPRYASAWPRLKAKYGLAVKSRLHKLYETYIAKRAILNNSGAGLSDADRAKFPEVNNLQELVRMLFVWYDMMDEFCHERAVVGLDSLVNSDDPADVSVLGVNRGKDSAPDGQGQKKQRLGAKGATVTPGDDDEESVVEVDKSGAGDEGKDENVPRTRGGRSAVVDLGPIGQAIREGDLLREKNKKERAAAIDEAKKQHEVRKHEQATAALAYKMKRDELRCQLAREKMRSEESIKSKELEMEQIRARLREKEMILEERKLRILGSQLSEETQEASPSNTHSSATPSRRASSSLAHLLL